MPAYNAEKTLQKTYDEIPKDIVDEIILTDDCSKDETVQARGAYLQAQINQSAKDQVFQLLSEVKRGPYNADEAAIRRQLAKAKHFDTYSQEMQRWVLYDLGYYYQHYAPGDERKKAPGYWAQLQQMFPESWDYTYRYLQTATDYGLPEEAKPVAAENQ